MFLQIKKAKILREKKRKKSNQKQFKISNKEMNHNKKIT